MTSDVIEILRMQADEIARAGHNGWGNTMTMAADALEAARGDVARYRWMRSLTHENAEVIGRWGAGCGHDPAWLDAAIDAARKEPGND